MHEAGTDFDPFTFMDTGSSTSPSCFGMEPSEPAAPLPDETETGCDEDDYSEYSNYFGYDSEELPPAFNEKGAPAKFCNALEAFNVFARVSKNKDHIQKMFRPLYEHDHEAAFSAAMMLGNLRRYA